MRPVLPLCLALAVTIQLNAEDKQTAKPKPTRNPNTAFRAVKDDPSLPRVLLLGDSISIGYTVPVRTLLKGKANDLYTFAKPQLEKIQRPANVHFSPEGSKTLAKQVVAKIEAALTE